MTSQTPAGDGPVPPGATPPTGEKPWPATGFFHQLRGIGVYRSDERWVGGVAGGIAARFGLDPLLVRAIFLATLVLGGFGLVVYAIAWALLPEERDGRIHMEGLTLGHPDIALLGSLLMLVTGLGWTAWVPFTVPGWIQGLFWLGATIVIVVLVVTMLQHRAPPAPRPGAPFGAGPYPGPYPGSPSGPYTPPARPYTGPSAPYTGAGAPAGPAAYFAGPGAAAPHVPGASSYGGPPPAGPATPAAATAPRASAPIPPSPTWSAPPPAPAPYRYVAAPPAPVATQPPRPPRPRRPGPGATTVGISVALSLFVVAGALIAQRVGWLDRTTAGTAAALVVLIFGVAIIVSGLRGRRSGVLSLLAIVAALVALPIAVTVRDGVNPWIVDGNGVHVTTTQGTTTITDRATAADGFRMGFGDATVDLTAVPLQAGDRLTVPIDVSAGNLVVRVPRGAQVAAQADIGAGQVTWQVGGDNTSTSGVGRRDSFGVPADQATLLLQIHVGAGNVTVEEGSR
jgi:phage shock protein PspC (stress-responsive transcriptional regulator)